VYLEEPISRLQKPPRISVSVRLSIQNTKNT
jgi:hypothetical protein